jgi:hypothetical protein
MPDPANPDPAPTPSPDPAQPGDPSSGDDPGAVAPPPEVGDERPALIRFVAGAEPVVGRVTSAVGTVLTGAGGAIQAAGRRWNERPGARVRRVRRMAREPLAMLYDVHPDARRANPRELGIRTVDLDAIAGTAVGGITQRGGDFLPLRPFRSPNWHGRWQRIRSAVDRLAVLPPIDVVKYGDRYWVLDGHNRVAAALYNGAVGVDANVTELVPPGQNPSERPSSLAPALGESRALRTAGHGDRVSGEVMFDDVIGRPRRRASDRSRIPDPPPGPGTPRRRAGDPPDEGATGPAG